jgi:exopolysaccharide biosynthesis protein
MFVLSSLFVAAVASGPLGPPIKYDTFGYGRNRYHIVVADLSSTTLSAGTMHSRGLTSVWKMIGREQPIAAITGTFFAPRQQKPVADVLVDGKLVANGARGTAIGVNYNGNVKIFDQGFGQTTDWLKYRFGMRGAVRVISSGKVSPNPKAQKFRDRRIWGRAARTGLGITKYGKLVLIATTNKVTLSELGKAMRSRGVMEAVSLDGGTSTCLYYKGAMVVRPGRKLSNLFIISKRGVVAAANSSSKPTTKAIAVATKR